MYKIEETDYGFKIHISGNLSSTETHSWINEFEEMIKTRNSATFHILLDLREIKDFDSETLNGIEKGLRVFKQRGMERSVLVLDSTFTYLKFKKNYNKSKTTKDQRYLDASTNSYWEQAAGSWLSKGIDPSKKSRLKIREKLAIAVAGTVLAVLTLLGFFIYSISYSSTKEMVDSKLQGTVKQVKDMIESNMHTSIKNHLRAISEKNAELARYYYNTYKKGTLSEKEAYRRYKEIILNTDSDYGKIGITGYLACVNTKGILVIHPKSEGADASKFEFMQKAIQQKNGFLEYDWKNKDETHARSKVGYLSYFEPWDLMVWASSYKDEFKDLIKIEDFHKHISDIVIGDTGYVYVIDEKGTMISHKNTDMIGKNYYNLTDTNGSHFVQEIISKKEGHIKYLWKNSPSDTEKEKLVFYTHIPETNWYVVAGSYTNEFFASLHTVRNVIIGSVFISFLILFFVITKSLSFLLSPFDEVKMVVNGIAEGDFTRKIEIKSKDEIGEISGYFNLVIDNFTELILKLKDSITGLLGSTQNLSVTSREISATSNTQAAAVREIVSTMEDSNTLAKQISVSIGEVNKISNQTKNDVETGVAFIQSSLEKMTEIKSKNKETIIGIKALGEKIDSIWDIVNIINGIVDQTKIIAFNAALEASSAGEAGKNFQIVASEIKRLADNTTISTKEIKSKISEIQSSSNNLIIISEEGSERVKEGWDLSNKLEEVFNEILNSADISARSAGQIDLSIKQQVSSFEQILLTLKEISGGIENFVVSTQHTSQASESLNQIASDLKKIIEKYIV